MRLAAAIGAVLASATAIWLPVETAGQEGPAVGVVLKITGPAYLRSPTGGAELRLDSRRDVGRKLYAGQSLRAGPGGRLKLGLTTGEKEIGPSGEWFVLQPGTNPTPQQIKVAQALRAYGSPGGARGIGSSVFSPAEGSAVRASRMVIRWNAPKKRGSIQFAVETEGGQELWGQSNVDGSAGKLDSEAVRKALADYQAAGGQQILVLTMADSDGNKTRVTFGLPSKASEQELEKELAEWGRVEDPLLRSIGRAYAFSRRTLLVEAAEEYEVALALAPESQDLISTAIEAHGRTGNYARVQELRKRQTPAQNPPGA